MLMQTLIPHKKLNSEARTPEAGSDGAAGYDVRANNVKLSDYTVTPGYEAEMAWGLQVAPGELVRIGLGLAFEIPVDRTVKIEVRSGMAGIGWAVEGGRLDSDYRGEVVVLLRNQSTVMKTIASQEKIAQLIVQKRILTVFPEVTELSTTARGAGGFGSTGNI